MKKQLLFVLLTILALRTQAQDAHYSQFYLNPLSVNPALVGVMNGSQRYNVTYRNQWSSLLRENAFNSYRFDYDTRFWVGESDFMGLGGSVSTDKGGSLGLGQTAVQATLSYNRQLGGNRAYQHYLSVGFQGGVAQQQINWNQTTWGSQSDRGVYNPTLPAQEQFLLNEWNNKLYGDVSFGLLWYGNFGKYNQFYGGVGAYHLNQPRQNILQNSNNFLSRRVTAQFGGIVRLSQSKFSLVPQLMTQTQSKLFELNLGTALRMSFDKTTGSFGQFGFWNRFGNGLNQTLQWEALIMAVKFDLGTWSFGAAYDLNTSGLGSVNRSGGLELNLNYLVPAAKRTNVRCPRF